MSPLEQVLRDILCNPDLRMPKNPVHPGNGICSLVIAYGGHGVDDALQSLLEHLCNRGLITSAAFPVPAPRRMRQRSLKDAYWYLPRWRGEYGRNRRDLLRLLIRTLKEERACS